MYFLLFSEILKEIKYEILKEIKYKSNNYNTIFFGCITYVGIYDNNSINEWEEIKLHENKVSIFSLN